jgi:aminopeptidase N
MIESYVGPDAFRRGVASYLKRFSYANAAGEDFWNEVAGVTGRPVDRILRSFVDRAGAPVLSVETRCAADKMTEVDLRMQRFLGIPNAPREDRTWTLPVCLRPSSAAQPRCEVIEQPKQAIRLNGCSTAPAGGAALVVANSDSRGYYFTEYSPETARALARSNVLKAVERLSLLGDEWWMVRGGRHDIGVYLDVGSAFADEKASAVLETLADRLTQIGEDLVPADSEPAYHAWIRRHFGQQLSGMGLSGGAGDDDETQARRATLLELVGISGNDPAVQKRSLELATPYLKDARALPPTLAASVLRVGAFSGDGTLYDQYVSRLGALAAQPEEYYRFLNALPWFKEPALVRRTLDYSMSSAIRTQDTGALLGSLLLRPWSREMAWEFVQGNWQTIVKNLGEFQGIPAIVESLGGFCSAERAGGIRAFFEKHPIPSSQRAVQQALERIENCVALKERQARPLASWIAANSSQ